MTSLQEQRKKRIQNLLRNIETAWESGKEVDYYKILNYVAYEYGMSTRYVNEYLLILEHAGKIKIINNKIERPDDK